MNIIKVSLVILFLLSFAYPANAATIDLVRSTVEYTDIVDQGGILEFVWNTPDLSNEEVRFLIKDIPSEFDVDASTVQIISNKGTFDKVIKSSKIALKSTTALNGNLEVKIKITMPSDCPENTYTLKLSEMVGSESDMLNPSSISITVQKSSTNLPLVTVLYPNGGEFISVGTQVQVSAQATDDNAVTSVTFYYSSNGGSNWNSIGAGMRVSGTDKNGVWNITWNTNGLTAGTNYLVKAVASDGTLTDEDESDTALSLSGTQPKTSVKEMWRYKTNGGIEDVEIADIDNDGVLDVIVASDKIYVLNKSGGKEQSFGQNIESVGIGDLNGNGIKDIIAAKYGGIISAYTGSGLEMWKKTLTTDYPKIITSFDLNSNGLDEVILASRECKFYLISGDGSILWIYPIGVWSDIDSMDGTIMDDINNDNIFDTVVGGRDSKITALSGDDGSVLWRFTLPDWVGSIINAGDLNGDAYDDVVVGSWDTDVYAINGNNGSLLWKFETPLSGKSPASVETLGDINSDGTRDVAVGLNDVYALDGKTGHQIWKSEDSFLGIEDIVTTDLNGDGILDVCIGTNGCDPYANVYAVNGNNGNTIWSFLEPKSTILDLTAGDIDNDGKNDIIVGSQDTYVYVLTTLMNIKSTIFDTEQSETPYPSIPGTHTGTIKPTKTIEVQKLYTYPCAGTGGHTESVRIYGNDMDKSASWNGYGEDEDTITFDSSFTLEAGKTYNYVIETGSYPQIHHTAARQTANGWLNCTSFVDANGKEYDDWMPAITLYG